jgi:quercetin dioxygenase-like cupin family protein
MPVLKATSSNPTQVRDGVSRRLIHGNDLMMVAIDFTNGPWAEPEPLHQHVHEQTTYLAQGEVVFFCEGEKEERLSAGDMFWVPSNKKHGIRLLSPSARLIDCFNPLRDDFLR